jgi:hypothetical protein
MGQPTARRRWLPATAAVGVVVVATLVVVGLVRDPDPVPAGSSAPETSTAPSPSPSAGETSASRSAAPATTADGTGGETGETHPSPPQSPDSAAGDPFTPGSLAPVPVEPAVTLPPVPLDEPASFGSGLVARVTGLEAVQGEARGPGETAGPALRLVVAIRNSGGRAVSLASAVVSVSYGPDLAPAAGLSGPGVRPLAGSVPPGGSATGSYVFGVPGDDRADIQVSISLRASRPTVLFEGSAP